jgi:hypothetical protein
MADLSITAANVLASASASTEYGTAGATITAGQAVYYDTADSKWKLADADSATAAVRMSSKGGIALNGASDGQPLKVLRSGDITIGGTLTAGSAYYLSPNPGGIGLIAEVLSGDYIVFLGIAKSTTVLNVNIIYSGATVGA